MMAVVREVLTLSLDSLELPLVVVTVLGVPAPPDDSFTSTTMTTILQFRFSTLPR